jgi:NADPH-dependent glutamate synthase beta subunit-like oxidoreductase/ferredoxin
MPKLNARDQMQIWKETYGAPCQAACPVHTDARSYVTLIAEGRFEDAYLAARERNPLVAMCGRACSAPCEDVCTRAEFDGPVRIRQLKRFLTDRYDMTPGSPAKPPTGKRVAVIGAGPAGLTAAHDLARLGHKVVIYESAEIAGGMTVLGIPRFRLGLHAINQDVEPIKALGVEIRTRVHVGRDVSVQELREANDAVFIASGAMRLNNLDVPGVLAPGVVQALAYLQEANLGGKPPTGRQLIVIGGGYTAMDTARTAVRMGAESVTVLYRRTRSETEVHDGELNETVAEGVKIQYLVSPLQVVQDENGALTGLLCVRNALGEKDSSGRPRPVPIPGSDFTVPADMILLAIGQTPDPEDLGFAEGDLIRKVDPETMMTGLDSVFAGGDFVTGSSTIIEAVRDGGKAAEAIHRYLVPDGEPDVWPLEVVAHAEESRSTNGHGTNGHSTNGAHKLSMYEEVERAMTLDAAMREALRCLSCGLLPVINFEFCTLCHACTQVCPADSLFRVSFETLGGEVHRAEGFRDADSYTIDEDLCDRCGRCIKVCPTNAIGIKPGQ